MWILSTRMAPQVAFTIPFFLAFRWLGLADTVVGLALVYLTFNLALVIWMMKSYFDSVPRELEEAAWIDGCSRLRVLVLIVLPLSRPALSTVAVLTFLSVWNDFLWPLVVIATPDNMTVQLGLATFQSAHFTNWPVLMAATMISQIPVFVLFLVGQRWFVQSIASTGIK